jgi:DNA-binding response OmpR family regulator
MKKILVVDDEKKIVEIVKAYLEKDGFQIVTAYDGQKALEAVRSERPDLMVLDLMLPDVSGWEVCRAVRKDSNLPIIMLTARDEVTDKIVGLEMGADDYVTKPFDPKELVSRIRAVLRRIENVRAPTKTITLGELVLDVDKRTLRVASKNIEVTQIEFDILKVLAESPGRVYSRLQLLDKIQDDAYEGYERTIDSHIKNIRKKIESDPDHPHFILTVYGVGYKMREF